MLTDCDKTIVDADCIHVRGARVHNLRGVDVDIPRQRLTVITGVSGSGKSSLAFDTIHAESQRRYLESLAAETRTRVGTWQRPDVDVIDGLPPTISVGQPAGSASLRSTLATTTEILDYLRLLFARCGQAHCPKCAQPLSARSSSEIVEQILSFETGRKVMILAPLVRGRKGAHRDIFELIAKSGFVRVRVDGQIVEASQPPTLAKTKLHTIEAIVDRIVVKEGLQARLRESVELALKHGSGSCVLCVQVGDVWEDHAYSSRFACADCGISFVELEPRTFSFNSPYGACLTCRGVGVVVESDTEDHEAITARQSERRQLCTDCGGSRLNEFARCVTFGGLTLPEFLGKTVSEAADFVQMWEPVTLTRIASESGKTVDPSFVVSPLPSHVLRASVGDANARVLERTLPAIRSRLEFLIRVGADYLTLDRPTPTLSGGEFQRARLAACLGSGLVGACYVLDEPTVGLHPKDTAAMLVTLRALRDQGNTVIVVEHDPDVMRQADHLIDLGPGAGADGGQVVSCGTPSQVADDERSVTGRFLKDRAIANCADIVPPSQRHFGDKRASETSAPSEFVASSDVAEPLSPLSPEAVEREQANLAAQINAASQWLTLSSVRVHNLHDVSVRIPLAALTAITGVSGSGKTSLVHHALVPFVRAALTTGTDSNLGIARLVEVTQSPLGRTPASNPATYSGVWDEICKLFAQTREARLRGFRASRFRFNSPSGRCEACRGRGVQRVRLQLLPDVFVTCPVCRGERFNSATLQVRFRGLTAADVLRLRITEAAELFANISRVASVLRTFGEVGLGYLRLGQSATTLSGGEAQRVKLATELSRDNTAATLFVLDEPTTGLHPADVERLLSLLRRLVNAKHTVVVIEHHLDVIARADWLIDLGPNGGSRGGRIVAEGTPQQVAATDSHTAQALRGV